MSPYVWLIVAAVMALIEMVSMGLITIWFVVGGLAAFLAAYLGADLAVQIVVFLVISVVCLALFRPLIMKHRAIGESHESTPVGLEAVVVEAIGGNQEPGRVETPDHMTWVALSADDLPLEVGTRVRVVDNESIKLVVEKMDE